MQDCKNCEYAEELGTWNRCRRYPEPVNVDGKGCGEFQEADKTKETDD